MKQITAAEFKAAVALDPAWATTLTEPVEITNPVNLEDSPITHLSPLLHFTGRDTAGKCAYFRKCAKLTVAEGNFSGWVGFSKSGIEKIGDLKILGTDERNHAAAFRECTALKTAEGTFPGFVTFQGSAIEKIGGLTITHPGIAKEGASFENCRNLKVAEGTFPGFVNFSGSGVATVGKLEINTDIAKADFRGCDIRLPEKYIGSDYLMNDATRQKNLVRIAASKAQKASPDLEI